MSRSITISLLASTLIFARVNAAEIRVHRELTLPELALQDGFSRFISAPGPLYGPPGSPQLPHVGHQLLLPPGEEIVSANIENAVWNTLPGKYYLWPAQQPVPYSKIPDQPFTAPDPAIYSASSAFPATALESFRTDFLCGHGIGSISICAARYFPASERLEALLSYNLVVQTAPSTRAQTAFSTMLKQGPRVVKRINKLVENGQALSAYGNWDEVDNIGCQYLIITAAQFESCFQELAEQKVNRGMTAEIVLIEDIVNQYAGVDTAEQLRNCIIDYYQTQPLEYILLGGDVEYVPTRGLYCYMGEYTDDDIPGDLYFSNLDGNWNTDGDELWGEPDEADLIAEVAVGRLTVDSQTEAQNAIAKTIAYEDNPVLDDQEEALMVGEDLGWFVSGGQIKEEIRLGSSNWGYNTVGFPPNFNVQVLYDMYGTWSATGDLLPLLNGGLNLINHMGHANNLYVMKFSESQINSSSCTNNGIDDNFYIIYSQGCYAAAFDNRTDGGYYTVDAIAEQFTTIQHGAVAFVGNSRYGWGDYNSTNGPSQYFDRQFFDAIFFEQIWNLGWTNADSKEDNIPFIGYGTSLWPYYCLNLLGDPALEVWTATPQALSPDYPDPVILGTSEIEVNAGVQGALVALVRDGEVLAQAWSDFSGAATLSLDEPIAEPGPLILSITAHDYLPFQGEIQAVPSNGPYVILLESEFDDSAGGDGDGNPELAETLNFSLSFQNVGIDPAQDVNATFECADYCVQISPSSAFVGDVAVDSVITLEDAFQATLTPSVYDGQVLTFVITLQDSQDSTWTFDFSLTASAPGLQLLSWNVDDGNDAHLTPGETAQLDLEIANQGSQETTDLYISLTTDNPLVELLTTAPIALDPLLPGDSASVLGLQFTPNAALPDPSAVVLYISASDSRNYHTGFLIELPVGGIWDDMESGVGDWTHANVTPNYGDQWNLYQSTGLNHTPGGNYSWYCGQFPYYSDLLDAGLVTPEYQLNGCHELHFYQWMSAQISSLYPGEAYDGGIVEFSLNGGEFQQITPRGGYPYFIRQSESDPGPFAQGTPCYSGVIIWEEAIFDVEGEGTGRFRFRFGSDGATNSVGWAIDDLQLVKASDPNAPTDLHASVAGPEITLTWSTPNLNGLPSAAAAERTTQALEQYRIYRNDEPIAYTQELTYVDNLSGLPAGNYYYQVCGIFSGEEGPLSPPVSVDYVAVKPADQQFLPENTALLGTYPNPFNPRTIISFDLAEPQRVTLIVFDLQGRQVEIVMDQHLEAGRHEAIWNGANYASGLYLVRMQAGPYHAVQKAVLLK